MPDSGKASSFVAECEGEIHNFAEIRNELTKSGFEVGGNGNDELVSNAYRVWGEESPGKFNGAFAFYVLDGEKRKLVLARDQGGRIPLYYSCVGDRFVFSSDLDEIVKLEGFSREIDPEALNFYLTMRYVPEERSIFKNIRKVLPGCCVLYDLDSGNIEKRRYWEPPMEEPEAGNARELLEELEALLEDAIRIRIDGGLVQPGAFLSGGLDSSLITAFMSRLSSNPVKTFVVGYSAGSYDERRYSKIVADYFGTDHHELLIEPDKDRFMNCVCEFREPLADPSIIPTSYALSLAGKNTDSVVSGDGADGLFLGFRTHRMSMKHLAMGNAMPKFLKYVRGKIAGMVPDEHKLRMFIEDMTAKQFFLRRNAVFSSVARKKLFKNRMIEDLGENFDGPEEYADSVFESYRGTFGGKMGFFTYKSDADDILYKIFSLSGALERRVRTPFLDVRVIEFALGKVPAGLKIKEGTTKYLLKKLAERHLPPELPLERKRGFNPPLPRWLRKEWRDFAAEVLLDGEDEFFERKYVERLLKLNGNPAYDQTRRLFALMVFKIWRTKHA